MHSEIKRDEPNSLWLDYVSDGVNAHELMIREALQSAGMLADDFNEINCYQEVNFNLKI